MLFGSHFSLEENHGVISEALLQLILLDWFMEVNRAIGGLFGTIYDAVWPAHQPTEHCVRRFGAHV